MKEISLYIHIPFCKQKCFYCDFPSYAGKESLMDEYVEALNKEILDKASKYIIKSIFIGGGTPSYLTNDQLDSLLKTINNLNFNNEIEFTIECNPGTLTKENLIIMKKNNVNRLSIGLQATNDLLLKSIGRIHTYEEFKNNYLLAREIGFENINIDLMFGLPNQSLEDWKETLKEIVNLNPDHISAYSLIIEQGTVFYNWYEKDKLPLPKEDDEREMYIYSKDMLKKNGYHQYEISNYSKNNKECYHNKVYWKCDEYLGVGVSSSSFINSNRFKNIDDIKEYIEKINKNEDVTCDNYKNTLNDNMEEFVFMGLRMIDGIEEKEFKHRFNKDIYEVYKDVIEKNIRQELLISNMGRLYLSPRGIEVSNYVMSDFIL